MSWLDQELTALQPALALESVLSRRAHKLMLVLSAAASLSLAGGYGYALYLAPEYVPLTLAGLSLCAGIFSSLVLLRLFHNSYYYRGFSAIDGTGGYTYEVARIFATHYTDVTAGLLNSPQGAELIHRLGISQADRDEFLARQRPRLSVSALPLPPGQYTTFSDLAKIVFGEDAALSAYCAARGITPEILFKTVDWTTRVYYQYKQGKRWWGRDNLAKFAGVGRAWSYGNTYYLNKYARPLRQRTSFAHLIEDDTFVADTLQQIERTLSRAHETNVMLVGEPGVGKLDILLAMAERIRLKRANPDLQDYHFVLLDTERVLAVNDTAQTLTNTLTKLLNEAATAGNVILVIENLSTLVRAGASLELDVPALIEPYLSAPELHLIFTEATMSYHHELEPLGIMREIEVLMIDPPSLLGTERVLESVARSYERRYHTALTYPGLQAIAASAERYVPTGVMPDKAIDLLIEVLAAAGNAGEPFVTEDVVLAHVAQKTGIPIGPIDENERSTLMHLEAELHRYVTGQDAALSVIASALRRARAGIQDADRPLGSFLFLGPTGVGKTETAKALATVLFGNEEHMLRFDMSEYSGAGALVRLIGEREHTGALADAMREHPYAVILLDEFEKGAQEVHDLFLQILDEGRFTDGRGQVVNLRNSIVIATSNAGSQRILAAVQAGADLASERDGIIDHIIANGTYRPELVNRFDGVVLFAPLSSTEQVTIARSLLAEVAARVAEKGYTTSFDESVVAAVATRGYDPKFGARPMRRVIQNEVEEAIARKIITDSLKKGTAIELTAADLTPIG